MEPVRVEAEDYTIDMVPWGYDIPEENGDILMGHLEVFEAVMNASGLVAKDGIFPKTLEDYRYVFLGHYHEAQSLPVPNAQWSGYLGAVMQIDLSLTPGSKGVTLLEREMDTSVVRFQSVPSPSIHAVTIEKEEDIEPLVHKIAQGNYWRVTVTDPALKLPYFDHRVQVEYDIKPKTESRLEEKADESLRETVVRFIDQVETKVDKGIAKSILEGVL